MWDFLSFEKVFTEILLVYGAEEQDIIDIKYSGEALTIAFNYKFILEFLKIVESEEVSVKLNSSLSATVFAPTSEEDYIYLVMPVQLRN